MNERRHASEFPWHFLGIRLRGTEGRRWVTRCILKKIMWRGWAGKEPTSGQQAQAWLLSHEPTQALSQIFWVQTPAPSLTSHVVMNSLPSFSDPQNGELQKHFLPLAELLCGLNELVHIKHSAECLAVVSVNGSCVYYIILVPK